MKLIDKAFSNELPILKVETKFLFFFKKKTQTFAGIITKGENPKLVWALSPSLQDIVIGGLSEKLNSFLTDREKKTITDMIESNKKLSQNRKYKKKEKKEKKETPK